MKEENIEFEGCGERTVKGKICQPEKESPPGLLMVHGFGGEGLRDYWLKTSKRIAEEGFATMTFQFSAYNHLPDLTKLTLKDEIKEIKLAIDYFQKQNVDSERMGIFAQSLGSCVSVMAHDPRIKAYSLLAFVPHLKDSFENVTGQRENTTARRRGIL